MQKTAQDTRRTVRHSTGHQGTPQPPILLLPSGLLEEGVRVGGKSIGITCWSIDLDAGRAGCALAKVPHKRE